MCKLKNIVTISLCFLSLTLFGQLNDSDAFFKGSYDKDFVHKHKIKQVTVQNYIDSIKSSFLIFDFDTDGLLKKETVFNKNLKKVNEYTFTYDKQGNQMQRVNINYQLNKSYTTTIGKIYEGPNLVLETESELSSLKTHSYNDSGMRVQTIAYLARDTATSPRQVFYYIYDSAGKLKSLQETTKGFGSTPVRTGTSNYIYDDAGHITAVIREGKANYSMAYDKKGFLKSKTIKMPEEFSNMTMVEEYSYVFWK